MEKISTVLLLALLSQSFFCLGQDESMVVVRSGLFIRDSTTVNTNSLCSVRFGEMVHLLNEVSVKGIVNGMEGNWVKVNYNNCIGYVFDAYLGNFKKRDKNFPTHYPQYFNLSAGCGEQQYFDRDLVWYGVFDDVENFRIASVTVEFSVKAKNWTDKMYDRYLMINVNSKREPLFLIGLPDSVPDYTITKSEFMLRQSIYPGESFHLSNISNKSGDAYYLASYGNVDDRTEISQKYFIPPFLLIKDYKIKIIEVRDGKSKAKDLFEDVEKPVIFESLPRILFVGDLNYDSVPDILFSYTTSHASANTYLFMSGFSKNELLTKVGLNRWEGCY